MNNDTDTVAHGYFSSFDFFFLNAFSHPIVSPSLSILHVPPIHHPILHHSSSQFLEESIEGDAKQNGHVERINEA